MEQSGAGAGAGHQDGEREAMGFGCEEQREEKNRSLHASRAQRKLSETRNLQPRY